MLFISQVSSPSWLSLSLSLLGFGSNDVRWVYLSLIELRQSDLLRLHKWILRCLLPSTPVVGPAPSFLPSFPRQPSPFSIPLFCSPSVIFAWSFRHSLRPHISTPYTRASTAWTRLKVPFAISICGVTGPVTPSTQSVFV